MYGSCRLPGAHVDEWHGRVAEIPEQKEIAVVCVAVALVLLPEGDAVNAVHRRMAHDAESREFQAYLLVGCKYLPSLEI